MKTRTLLKAISYKPFLALIAILSASFIITTTSCHVGSDGRPGLAYITFEWEVSKPDFIDCGTPAVPPNFYYGTYYRISPGWYTAFYEGKVWTGQAWGTYAWEMDYEIWVNPGQRGGYGYNGKDGLNTYMNFVCTPYGPKIYRHESYMRKAQDSDSDDTAREEVTGTDGTVEFQAGEYSVRMTYRKVEPRGTDAKSGNFPLN